MGEGIPIYVVVNMKNFGVLANAALAYFERCASLHWSLC